MSNQANVKSFDAIQQVRAVLLQFAKLSEEGLTECDLEMRRFVDWLEHDRPGFWKEQVRLAHDGVHQAKQDLQRCLMFPVGVNERPSCSEERAALKKAQAKLAYCEQKQERLRHWVREVRHELHTYEGRTTRLREVIESDTPKAVTALSRILASLEKYAGSTGGSSGGSSSSGTTSDSADEPSPDASAEEGNQS